MKGFLSTWAVAKELQNYAAELLAGDRYDLTVGEITDLMGNRTRRLVELAEVDVYEVAKEVLRENNHALTNQKIMAIKTVRERTSAGLKEAKDAVEQALPQVLAEQAEKVLEALARANAVAPYGYKVRVESDHHTDAIHKGYAAF